MDAKNITHKMHIDMQYLNSAVCSIHAAIEDFWGLCLQQSICIVNSGVKIYVMHRRVQEQKKEKCIFLREKHRVKSDEHGVQ